MSFQSRKLCYPTLIFTHYIVLVRSSKMERKVGRSENLQYPTVVLTNK